MILIPELETVVILVPRTGSGSLRRAIAEAYPSSMLVYRHMEADGIPAGYDREISKFKTTFARARDEVARQVDMLCGNRKAANLVISTNIPLRKDGLPLANQRKLDDPGVAVYFTHKGKQMCFACDRWKTVEDNMQAVAKTIDAIRGIIEAIDAAIAAQENGDAN